MEEKNKLLEQSKKFPPCAHMCRQEPPSWENRCWQNDWSEVNSSKCTSVAGGLNLTRLEKEHAVIAQCSALKHLFAALLWTAAKKWKQTAEIKRLDPSRSLYSAFCPKEISKHFLVYELLITFMKTFEGLLKKQLTWTCFYFVEPSKTIMVS